MAGDNKATSGTETVPARDWEDPFPGIQQTLDNIRDELRGLSDSGAAIFDIPSALGANIAPFSLHQWQRVHIASLVVSASAAGTAILTIGTTTRTWNIAAGVTVIPFPVTLERGQDLTIGGTGTAITAYLVGTGE